MARRWCNIPKTFFIHLCEAPDFDKGQDCWPPRDSVFIPMCNKRYISKPKNKEIVSVSGKTNSPMSFLSCSLFFWLNSHLEHDAIPRNPSCSASFSPLIFLLHYPFLISLYLWLNMYFSKDADSVPPPSNHPGSTGAGPWQSVFKKSNWVCFICRKILSIISRDGRGGFNFIWKFHLKHFVF